MRPVFGSVGYLGGMVLTCHKDSPNSWVFGRSLLG